MSSDIATPAGYVQGMSAVEAASTDRPVSRADEMFQPVKQLKDMIDTKRILINSIKREQDYEVYLRQRGKWVAEIDHLRTCIEGLDNRYVNGPAIIERLEKEIADLEIKVKMTEDKAAINKYLDLMKMLNASGVQIGGENQAAIVQG